MLAGWTKILPFIFIEWFALHNCERFRDVKHDEFVSPYKGTRLYFKWSKWNR